MLKNNDCIIVANPVSGPFKRELKKYLLAGPKEVLGCEAIGLDTKSEEEYRDCVIEAKKDYKMVICAGGDGTNRILINAGTNEHTILGYLKLGNGGALGSACNYEDSMLRHIASIIGYRGYIYQDLIDQAIQIHNGTVRNIDAILCETSAGSQKALMAGMGLDAEIIRRSGKRRINGESGLWSYVMASLEAGFHWSKKYTPDPEIKIEIDGETKTFNKLKSVIFLKHPFMGYSIRANPLASLDSGYVHGLAIDMGIPRILKALYQGYFKEQGNTQGTHLEGETINMYTTTPQPIHIEGDYWTTDTELRTIIIKNEFRMKF